MAINVLMIRKRLTGKQKTGNDFLKREMGLFNFESTGRGIKIFQQGIRTLNGVINYSEC